MFSKPRPAELRGADKVLEMRAKIKKAIKAEELKLLALIVERVKADGALGDEQTAAALEETANATGAQRKVDAAMAAIGRQANVLGGLRARVAGMALDLEREVRAVQAGLPAHIEGLKADFATEWAKGAAAFGALMGKRAALEALVGKLDLPVPQAEACDLGDAGAPWSAIQELKAGVDEIVGWNQATIAPRVDAMSGALRPFNCQAVYSLTQAFDGLAAGTVVMEPCFVPGILRHLVNIAYAEALTDQQWAAELEAGRQAASAISTEEAAERRQQEQAREPVAAYDLEKARAAAAANARVSNTEVPYYTGAKVTI